MIEELLSNPEKYRIGENYKATNIVFPVRFERDEFIVKKPGYHASLTNFYYVLQDQFFYGTRQLSTTKQRFNAEAEKLEKLNGMCAPKLVAYNDEIIIREYIEGYDFRNLSSDSDRKRTLDGAFNALEQIHREDIPIGDTHVKNTILSNWVVYWTGFSGLFNELDLERTKAVDVLKFVYSTYTTTKNPEIALYSAEIASKYSDKKVKAIIKDLVTPGLSAVRLWFPIRLRDKKLNREIKRILRE